MTRLNKLTVKQCLAAGPGKLFDGGGLYLLTKHVPDAATGTLAKYWRLKYRYAAREKSLSLGVFPSVSLERARTKRTLAKAILAEGRDPSAARKAEKAALKTAAESTFEAVAREWFKKRSTIWAESHSEAVMNRLENHIFPSLGREPIDELTSGRLLEVMRKVESQGRLETARRVRQYVQAIMEYAMDTGRLTANPTPSPKALAQVSSKSFAAITDPTEMGGLMRAIRGYSGSPTTVAALRLAPYLFVRPGELRKAEWAEIDLKAKEWAIPGARTKMRRDLIVPLCTQAVEILREQHLLTGHGRFVFPGERSIARPMSENTILSALRYLGYSKQQMTGHGFRHMASTYLHESRKWPSELIEMQLGHADPNEVRAIYNKAKHLDERARMMQWYADQLDALAASDNVVKLKARA